MRNKEKIEITKFNNFNSGDIRVENFYNYEPGETLANSYGIKPAEFPSTATSDTTYSLDMSSTFNAITSIAFTKQYFPQNGITDYRLLVCSNEYKVYLHQFLTNMNFMFAMPNIQFESAPVIMQCKKDDCDYIMLSAKEKLVVWRTNYLPYTIEDVPNITSMCYNDEILFCTIESPAYKIWYASDWTFDNIGNIDENSGYIILDDDIGYARKVLTYDEDVYVFRDYGITKIMNTKGSFSINQIYVSNTRILPNTVCLCGNEILFMTKEGIYSFNGANVAKLDVDISKYLIKNNNNAYASSLGEMYYVALNLDFNDGKLILCESGEYTNNAILILNVETGIYQIVRGIDVLHFCPAKCETFEKMLVTLNGENSAKICEICNTSVSQTTALPKFWSSQDLCETHDTKLFTKLSIVADENVKCNLILDDGNIAFTTYTNGLNEFNFKFVTKQIRLEISSFEESAEVKKLTLEYYENN